MAQGKKISELTEVSSVTDNDEFLFVDKEGSGANSGQGGKTAKIKFSDLKSAIGAGTTGAKGASGDKGMKGEPGPRGLDGAGTQYWTQSPTDGDAVYYNAGNVGIGTDSPKGAFHVQPTSDRPFIVSSTGMVGIGVSQGGMNMGSDLSQYHLELASHSLGGPTLGLHNYRNDLTELGKINFVAGQGDGIVTAQIIGSRDVGDGSGSSLRFSTKDANADPVQERMIIAPNGNVGIGTDLPIVPLHVKGNVVTSEEMTGGSGNGMLILETKETQPEGSDVGRLTIGILPYHQNSNGNWLEGSSFISARTANLILQPNNKSVGIGVKSDQQFLDLTGGSSGYKLVVSDDSSSGTSILMHNSYAEGDHSPQTWRMLADPSKKSWSIGTMGSSFYKNLQLHSGVTGGFTFGDDGNGAKEGYSTIRFPSSGVYPSLDLIRNSVINESESKNYPGSGTVIQFGALKNDLDENYDPIPGTRGPQAGVRVSGGLYPARNAREDAPKNDRYPGNYGQFDVDVLESSTGSMVNRMKITEHGRAEFHMHQNAGNQKTYSSNEFAPHYGIQIRNLGDPDQAKFSGIGFQSSARTGGYATGWIGVVNGVGGQPTGDMVFGTRMADGTDNAYGERMRLTQDGDLYLGCTGSTNSHITNKMSYIKTAPYTWTGVDKVNDDIAAIGIGPVDGTGSDDGNIIFKTATNVNTGGELEQRMRIAHNGHVLITGNLSVGDKSNNLTDKSHFDIFADHNQVKQSNWSFNSPDMGFHPVNSYHFFTLRIPANSNENSWGVLDIDMQLLSQQSAGHTCQVVKSAKIFINRPTQNTHNNNSPVTVRIDNIGDNFTNEDGTAASVNSFDLSYQVTGSGATEPQFVKLLVNTTGDAAGTVSISGIASFKGSNNITRS
jgi:hypothetical protein